MYLRWILDISTLNIFSIFLEEFPPLYLQLWQCSLSFLSINISQSDFIWIIHPFICSSKSKVPVWPFLILSFFGGAYALLPYFVLWRPPPPPVDESELTKWPLNFLESKLTAWVRNFSLLLHAFMLFVIYQKIDLNMQLLLLLY